MDCVLDIVGFFEDDTTFKDEIDRLGNEGIVKFHGFQSDPIPYYAVSDCVVVPSYHEGMCNVLLEASSVGRPIITTDIPGCREIVDSEKNGILVSPKDGETLYNAMLKMVELNREERARMGLHGRKHVERAFDKSRVVADTIDHIMK